MDRQYDFAALEALLKQRSFKALREALLELNEVDIAEFLGLLNGEEAVLAFRTLPKGVAADVFAELEPETQQHHRRRGDGCGIGRHRGGPVRGRRGGYAGGHARQCGQAHPEERHTGDARPDQPVPASIPSIPPAAL